MELTNHGHVEKNERFLNRIFSRARQYIGLKKIRETYIKLDDNLSGDSINNSPISFFKLFQFSDTQDRWMIFIGLCSCVLHAVCLLTTMIIFGQLTGIFAEQSFIGYCQCRKQNSTEHIQNANRQATRMRISLLQSIIYKNMSYIHSNSIGELNTKLSENIDMISKGIGFELSVLIGTSVTAIGSIIVAFIINWRLALAMIVIVPLLIFCAHIFSKLTANETTKELDSYSKADEIVQEVFSSIRTVISLNGRQFEQKRYDNELHTNLWNSVRKGVIFGLFTGWTFFVTHLIYSAGFIVSCLLIYYAQDDQLNINDSLIILIVFAEGVSLFGYLGSFFQSISEARSAAVPVFQLITTKDENDANEKQSYGDNSLKIRSYLINGDIRFDRVNFTYPTRNNMSILNDISFIARVGQKTALVGRSGSGKSTCLSLLLRYYAPSSGQITIDGQSITEYNLKELRQNIGIVSQEPILFGTSIYENIRYGKLTGTETEIIEAARQANAHNFIMQLPNKYHTIIGQNGIGLSGGEKQRIALARALVKQPSILLLDEPTSALDAHNGKILQKLLDRVSAGRTTIVIAHQLKTIENAHRIYVFDKGSIVEHGTHQSLINKAFGTYKNMVDIQSIARVTDNASEIPDETYSENIVDTLFQEVDHHCQSNKRRNADPNLNNQLIADSQSILLRLLKMNKPEWKIITIGCFACFIIGGIQPISAVLLTKIVQGFKQCTKDQQLHQVFYFSFCYLLLGVFSLVIRSVQYASFSWSGSKLTEQIRSKAFSSLLLQGIEYFDKPENTCSSISKCLSSDALSIQKMTGTRLGIVSETVSIFFCGFLCGFIISWQLALIAIFPLLLFVIVAYGDVRLQNKANKNIDLLLNQANALAGEVIHNMSTIKELTLEEEILGKYRDLHDQADKIREKFSIISSFAYGVYWTLDTYTLIPLYWYALILVEENKLSIENSIIVFAFAMFSMQSMKIVMSIIRDIGVSLRVAQHFFDLFDRRSPIEDGSNKGRKLTDLRGEINFDEVQFTYPCRPESIVLDRFQLLIKPGQRVVFVGQSGCGKSTIFQLIERFYDVTHGQLKIDGINIKELDIEWIRSLIGFVSQEPILFNLTIAENISYGRENVSFEEIINVAKKVNIHQLIEQLPQGYQTKVGHKACLLSGGEKQRIAIARALLRQSKILLFDEITSAMDSFNEEIIKQTLDQIEKDDPNKTLIFITHRLSNIRPSDLIYFMHNGSIQEYGTYSQLTQQHRLFYHLIHQNSLS